MNITTRSALAEDSPERMDTIFKMATAQARTERIFRPITLELVKKSVGQRNIVGLDTYDVAVRDVTDAGRQREQRTVRIVQKFADFVDHPDYEGLMLHIPMTERNMAALATHVPDKQWIIHQEDISRMVEERAKSIKPVRDVQYEHSQPNHMGPEITEEETLRRRLERMTGQRVELQPQEVDLPHVGEPSPPVEATKSPEPPAPAPTTDGPIEFNPTADKALRERAKTLVYEANTDLLNRLKERSERYWLLKEYKDMVVPLIDAKMTELAAQPV